MVRQITDDDIGLKVLHDAPPDSETTKLVDIVAIHGIGAHPDDSWCKNVGTAETPQCVNWLEASNMLPAAAPNSRIMRYGYHSNWFGESAMRQKASTVAQRFLLALRRKRQDCISRPIIYIAHCFGGLVVLKALLDAQMETNEWPGIFASTVGLIFFGTPFRGAEGMTQMEMLDAARREYCDDEIQPGILNILEPGNEFLQEVVDRFGRARRQARDSFQVACFYELKSSNVGKIVGKKDRLRFVVSESSGCLDLSSSTDKYSLSRSHFDMNKFGKPTEEDFEIVSDVITNMIRKLSEQQFNHSACDLTFNVEFSLRGIPVLNHFVSREAELKKLEVLLLHNKTARRNVVVLHGMGGIGKTQLAIEFAREHQRKYSSVFWMDASSKSNLRQSFVEMTQRLLRGSISVNSTVISESQLDIDVEQAERECMRWLSQTSNNRWLLIFDNVDHGSDNDDSEGYDVRDYFPGADHGSILITSRLRRIRQYGCGFKVNPVTASQARAILEANIGKESQEIDLVLERLQGLPLALTQAGAYMRETNISASTYVEYYDSTWKRLMEKQNRFSVEGGDRNVLTTWTISYDRVREQSEEAANLLKLWGFLDCGELWYELAAAVTNILAKRNMPQWLLDVTQDKMEFAEAMGLLWRYSLVDAMEDIESHSMHLVLHKWCQQLTDGEEKIQLCCAALSLVAYSIPDKLDIDSPMRRKRLLAHGLCVSKWVLEESFSERDLVDPMLFSMLGYLLSQEDKQKEASYIYMLCLRKYTPPSVDGDGLDAVTANHLGSSFLQLGLFKNAQEMYTQVLRKNCESSELDSLVTLSAFNSLGMILDQQGQMDQAERMYLRARRGYTEALGAEHRYTLGTVNNLAGIYLRRGHLVKAEEAFREAQETYKKTLGAEHTFTISATNNLGRVLERQGRFEKAEELYKQALEGAEKWWGREHTFTLGTIERLGELYEKKGQMKSAVEMLEQAQKGFEKTLGVGHCTTLRVAKSLAQVLEKHSKGERAEKIYLKALEEYAKKDRNESGEALDTLSGLAMLYSNQGQLEKSEEKFLLAHRGYNKVFGRDYEDTLLTLHNLGNLYLRKQQPDKAEVMLQQALEGFKRTLGINHERTVTTTANLGTVYLMQGRLDDAETMYSMALPGYRQGVDPGNLDTYEPILYLMRNFATLYQEKSRVKGDLGNTEAKSTNEVN